MSITENTSQSQRYEYDYLASLPLYIPIHVMNHCEIICHVASTNSILKNGNKTLRSFPQQWLILRYSYQLGQFDVSCRNTEAKLAHMTDASL